MTAELRPDEWLAAYADQIADHLRTLELRPDQSDPLSRRPQPRPMLEADSPDLSLRFARLEVLEFLTANWRRIVAGMRAGKEPG
jgi:hypothetical protein